ncbi:GNAT family N-acetyltransferase [Sulfurimonas sp. HSL-1716]|uniref:GNAT family N-acetyltransferase n=1 Tax=Hydrocurvibacter sulfurireducens TaxID=3131937 RepID=UPI0031F81DCC
MMSSKEQRLKNWLVSLGAVDEKIGSLAEINRLDLSGRKIAKLPEEIGLLRNLNALNLSNNKLDSLPDSMRKLSRLVNLNLRRNSFKALPFVLRDINLRSINVSSNKLSDVSILQECEYLRVLDLSGNALKCVDGCFASNNEIRTLNLSSNLLHDMSGVFSMLKKVQRLDISDNIIKEIPQTVKELSSIEEFAASHNRIEKIDAAFFALDVERVDLSSNLLASLHLGSLVSLESLILDDNPFEILDIDDGFAPCLKELSCEGCGLRELLLPASENLELLCFSSNEIETIPKEIGRYIRLQELDIDGNKIKELPDTLANLSYLNILYVNGNPLGEEAKKVITILNPEICDMNMKTGITIEKAIKQDLPQMAELLGVLFAIESDFTIDYDKQLSGITRLFEHESSDLLAAKYEGRVVGMVTMQRLISSAEGDYVGQIEDLVVHEEYRKMGVGSRLINKMRSMAVEYGYKRIQLAADVDNKNALQFYSRRGFKKTHLNIYHYTVSSSA